MKQWFKAGNQERPSTLRGVARVRASGVVLLALAALTVTGCGIGPLQFGHNNPNPPFENRLTQMTSPISSTFDAKAVGAGDTGKYTNLTVYDANGHPVVLDVRKTPIFFEAYWCPHCQRTLKVWSDNRKTMTQLPVIVSLGFAKGSTVSDAAVVSKSEMKAFGLEDAKVYYYVGTPSDVVPGFPTLVFERQGQVMMMQGEHTLAIWEQALNSQP